MACSGAMYHVRRKVQTLVNNRLAERQTESRRAHVRIQAGTYCVFIIEGTVRRNLMGNIVITYTRTNTSQSYCTTDDGTPICVNTSNANGKYKLTL
jgi:hypothetical protein